MCQMKKILKVKNALDILMVFFHLFMKIYRVKKICIPHDRVKGMKKTPLRAAFSPIILDTVWLHLRQEIAANRIFLKLLRIKWEKNHWARLSVRECRRKYNSDILEYSYAACRGRMFWQEPSHGTIQIHELHDNTYSSLIFTNMK